jgi:hypothetical protein
MISQGFNGNMGDPVYSGMNRVVGRQPRKRGEADDDMPEVGLTYSRGVIR